MTENEYIDLKIKELEIERVRYKICGDYYLSMGDSDRCEILFRISQDNYELSCSKIEMYNDRLKQINKK